MKMGQSILKCLHIKFSSQGITRKKEQNIDSFPNLAFVMKTDTLVCEIRNEFSYINSNTTLSWKDSWDRFRTTLDRMSRQQAWHHFNHTITAASVKQALK
jgi:hypothetical protein